jgi:methylenetetrahydrofolate reductase (NADPH)
VPLIGTFPADRGRRAVLPQAHDPGVVISDALSSVREARAATPTRPRFFPSCRKHLAIFRGSLRGGISGGHNIEDVQAILEQNVRSLPTTGSNSRARSIPVENEFYYYARTSRPAWPIRSSRTRYEASLKTPQAHAQRHAQLPLCEVGSRRRLHPRHELNRIGQRIYKNSRDTYRARAACASSNTPARPRCFPAKTAATARCRTSRSSARIQCAKNQRNGPCGGTRDGKCEVYDFECIWAARTTA